MKQVSLLFALLIFVGAGCAGGPDTQPPEVPEVTPSATEEVVEPDMVDDTAPAAPAYVAPAPRPTPMPVPDTNVDEVEAETDTNTNGDDEVGSVPVSIELTATNFKYTDAQGIDNPTITVNTGDIVTIQLNIAGGFHNIVIDELQVASDATSSGSTSVTFMPLEPGTYSYYCSIGSHRANGMEGTIIVE